MDKSIGLYIHIPFCKSKCYYCDFASYPNQDESFSSYVFALVEEIKKQGELLKDKKVNTIFIGGGTPTVLPLDLIETILQSLLDHFNIVSNAEITIESNPGTLNFEMLKLLKENHINRISMGLQAYQNRLLKNIGRIHTIEEFISNFFEARKLGFDNINIDLMFSLPNQTKNDWHDTLRNVIDLHPEHISCYSLTIEESTPFGKWQEEGKINQVDEALDRSMYHYAQWYLNKKGYTQYEISNFSKPGFESRHNLTYWEYRPYIGMGLGAHSFFNGERFHNTYDLNKYINANGDISKLKEGIERLSLPMQYSEYMFLGLRLNKGISIQKFESKFKIAFNELFGQKVEKFIELRLLEKCKDNIKLTPKGLDVSNTVFAEFLLE